MSLGIVVLKCKHVFFLWNTLKKWINCLLARWLSLWKSLYSHFKCCKWNVVLHYPHMTSHMFFQKYSKNKLCLMYCLQSKFPPPGLKFWEGILLEWENKKYNCISFLLMLLAMLAWIAQICWFLPYVVGLKNWRSKCQSFLKCAPFLDLYIHYCLLTRLFFHDLKRSIKSRTFL